MLDFRSRQMLNFPFTQISKGGSTTAVCERQVHWDCVNRKFNGMCGQEAHRVAGRLTGYVSGKFSGQEQEVSPSAQGA